MIRDWRARFEVGDFPFLIVQLANYMDRRERAGRLGLGRASRSPVPDNQGPAQRRLAWRSTSARPRTSTPATSKTSPAASPSYALATSYGKDVEYSGPVYKSADVGRRQVKVKPNLRPSSAAVWSPGAVASSKASPSPGRTGNSPGPMPSLKATSSSCLPPASRIPLGSATPGPTTPPATSPIRPDSPRCRSGRILPRRDRSRTNPSSPVIQGDGPEAGPVSGASLGPVGFAQVPARKWAGLLKARRPSSARSGDGPARRARAPSNGFLKASLKPRACTTPRPARRWSRRRGSSLRWSWLLRRFWAICPASIRPTAKSMTMQSGMKALGADAGLEARRPPSRSGSRPPHGGVSFRGR